MSKARTVDGTVQQRVYDALLASPAVGCTIEEIAAETGLTESTVRNAINEIRRQQPDAIRTAPSCHKLNPSAQRPIDRRGGRR